MKQGVVVDKEDWLDHEAGTGSLYIPILGDLFPKLFSHEMKAIHRYFLLVRIDSIYRYEVTKDLYEEINIKDNVEIGTDRYGMPNVKLKKD